MKGDREKEASDIIIRAIMVAVGKQDKTVKTAKRLFHRD